MRALLTVSLLLCAACASTPRGRDGKPIAAPQALEEAEDMLAEGSPEEAVELLIDVQDSKGLDTAMRHRVELMLERAALDWLDRLVRDGADSEDLLDLYDENLPRRARVSVGIAAARQQLAEDEPLEAFETIKRIDAKFKSHHERAGAGNVVAEAGFRLARSQRRYLLFFSYRDRASEALEYLVLNYPSNPACEEAYLTLARLYEEDDEIALAQERHEDLVLYFPQSPFAPFSEAKIPELRMSQVRGAKYDRDQLERASRELAAWLERHADDPQRPEVERRLADCKRRLAENDIVLARFYDRIEQPFGVRLHGDRALELAREIEDADLVESSSALLERGGAEGP